MFNKTVLQEGVTLYVRNTKQFKTINLSIKFKSELDVEKNANRAVLANVLQDSNAVYRSQSEFQKALDSLYGTVYYTDVSKRGDVHMLSINTECVNDEYLKEQGVFEEVLNLMRIVLFEPNFQNGSFEEEVVNREKRVVKERIRSVYDDKTRYAQKRMLELMRPDQPASISAYGTESAVDKINAESLTAAYNQMLESDEVDIYVVGDIDEDVLIQKISSLIGLKGRKIVRSNEEAAAPDVKEVRNIREKQEMKQGKLQVGYQTPITFNHPDFTKMQVANGVLGGFAHSKLFMNVREKESMAYYVNSAYASHYGIIYVLAGIDADLEEKAVKLIEEQLEAMRNGDVSDLEINQTVALLSNSIRGSFDSAKGQIEVFDQYKQLDEHFNADNLIQQWETVTKEDIVKMASNIKMELVYLLSGREATE
ncbi:EF-P 5-aminopentanol modification-associated protein YfmF [Sporosarcina sp. Te-1]|uniref:EF-P 5-aminopentanol modification-associated protein YfmF n=1 Tax=Sporosarcina sp. Te-1 TaxID=2818390 RepID=UPI001A9D9F87|nr:pitrilysin family protein [Sporosarcina sp. Te-1]QTD42267.1 insulinase family protein [Sporosarcina sp. Te-1]